MNDVEAPWVRRVQRVGEELSPRQQIGDGEAGEDGDAGLIQDHLLDRFQVVDVPDDVQLAHIDMLLEKVAVEGVESAGVRLAEDQGLLQELLQGRAAVEEPPVIFCGGSDIEKAVFAERIREDILFCTVHSDEANIQRVVADHFFDRSAVPLHYIKVDIGMQLPVFLQETREDVAGGNGGCADAEDLPLLLPELLKRRIFQV